MRTSSGIVLRFLIKIRFFPQRYITFLSNDDTFLPNEVYNVPKIILYLVLVAFEPARRFILSKFL